MFRKRFSLFAAMLVVVLVSLAVFRPSFIASTSAASNQPSNAGLLPITGSNDRSDYHQRITQPDVSTRPAGDLSDYFLRHPGLPGGLTTAVDITGDRAPLDECFDVSLSEIAQCREASQSPSR